MLISTTSQPSILIKIYTQYSIQDHKRDTHLIRVFCFAHPPTPNHPNICIIAHHEICHKSPKLHIISALSFHRITELLLFLAPPFPNIKPRTREHSITTPSIKKPELRQNHHPTFSSLIRYIKARLSHWSPGIIGAERLTWPMIRGKPKKNNYPRGKAGEWQRKKAVLKSYMKWKGGCAGLGTHRISWTAVMEACIGSFVRSSMKCDPSIRALEGSQVS